MHQSTGHFDTTDLGKVMCIWAHPDDETFTMGGLLYACASNNQQVICVTATHGEAGEQGTKKCTPQELGDIRSKELAGALKILGIKKHHWLDYQDGLCKQVPKKEAVTQLVALINQYKPDSIFTFGPDGLTGHDDHKAVSEWTSQAIKSSGSKAKMYHFILTRDQYTFMKIADERINIFFNIKRPRLASDDECAILYKLPAEVYAKKIAALQAMPSQTSRLVRGFEHVLPNALGVEAFRAL